MNLPEIFTALTDTGFVTSVNSAHTQVFVRLSNRQVSTMEVWAALGYSIDRSRLARQGDAVVITE